MEGFDTLNWRVIEERPTDWEWEEAWEAIVRAGVGDDAASTMASLRASGAGPRGAALVAAALISARTPGALSPEQMRALRRPLVGLIELAPFDLVPKTPARPPTLLTWMRRCPLAAAAGLAAP